MGWMGKIATARDNKSAAQWETTDEILATGHVQIFDDEGIMIRLI